MDFKKNAYWIINFSGSLTNMDNASRLPTCISSNNQPYMDRNTLVDLNPDECNQELRYYPFMSNLDSCNTLDNISVRNICSKQTRRRKFECFNMITRINELCMNQRNVNVNLMVEN